MGSFPKLKVTGLTGVPEGYKGEPCILSMHIIDKEGGVYESDIHFDNGITSDSLREAMMTIFRSTDAVATEVKIKSFRLKSPTTPSVDEGGEG